MEHEKLKTLQDDDFVVIKDGKNIMSGGFSVNSVLLKLQKSPMFTMNNNTKYMGGGENVSDLFKDLAVPAGLFFHPMYGSGKQPNSSIHSEIDEDEELQDDIYDKLIELASTNKKYVENPKSSKFSKKNIHVFQSNHKKTKKTKTKVK